MQKHFDSQGAVVGGILNTDISFTQQKQYNSNASEHCTPLPESYLPQGATIKLDMFSKCKCFFVQVCSSAKIPTLCMCFLLQQRVSNYQLHSNPNNSPRRGFHF